MVCAPAQEPSIAMASDPEVATREAKAQALFMKTEDFKRAYSAFDAKEKPVFEGN